MARNSLYQRIIFFVVHHILHTDDTPSRIARGVAIGVFMAWLPLLALQMLLVLALSFIFRANKVVGLPVVWISNPFTLGPIYYPSYLLGSAMLRLHPVNIEDLEGRFATVSYLPWAGRLKELADLLFGEIYYPTFIGSLVTGTILAVGSYFLTVRAVERYRQRRIARRARKLSKLARRNIHISSGQNGQTTSPDQEPKSKAG